VCTTRTFTAAQITTNQTGLGTLVEVPLKTTIDTGGIHFGFFLPAAPVTPGGSVSVTTIGVTETFSGPDSVPHRPTTWQCVALQGTERSGFRLLYAVTIQDARASGDLAAMRELSAQAEKLLADQGDVSGALQALKAEITQMEAKAGG
jgi:Domain of unknown function (DUF1843)